MKTQVSFTTDEQLKEKVFEKAKQEGLTLKAFLMFCMKSYVDGKICIGVTGTEEPEVEELHFSDVKLQKKASKIAKLIS